MSKMRNQESLLRRAPFRMPKILIMGFFKKRKGLRQGGKEGLKTSARNLLSANTPRSDKKFAPFIVQKIILLKPANSCCKRDISGDFFAITAVKVFSNPRKIFLCCMERFHADDQFLKISFA